MIRQLSDQQLHAAYCPVRNPKSALFVVAAFALMTFGNWHGLHDPIERPGLAKLLLVIVLLGLLAKWLAAFTCFRERLLIGVVIISLAASQFTPFAPAIFGDQTQMIRSGKLVLSLIGLLIGLTILVQSLRNVSAEPSET
jgi:hypothetical protein